MLYIKEANLDDWEAEYEFIHATPHREIGFVNNFYNVEKNRFIKVCLNVLINISKLPRYNMFYHPTTTYFLWLDDKVIGIYHVIHELTEHLRNTDGHISYSILKEYRQKGYGSKGLSLVLDKVKDLIKEDEIYMHTTKDNPGSLKVMLNNGAYIAYETETDYFTRIKLRDENLYLKATNLEDIEEEYNFLYETPTENGFENPYYNSPRENFEIQIEELINHSKGINLPEGYVPDTYYFLWNNKNIVGLFKLRHYLNEHLKNGSGHIGYAIRPTERGKGYATKGLALMIKEAKKIIPEKEIYLSVNKNNPISLKVQENNGAYIVGETTDHYLTRIKIDG